MMLWMHGCDMGSLWIEVPMLLCCLTVLPAWARRANSFSRLILRSIAIVGFAIALVTAYLSWLHSDYFPRWLLFPKPRTYHRPPNKARAANPAMASLFHAGRQWRGVADAPRWPKEHDAVDHS